MKKIIFCLINICFTLFFMLMKNLSYANRIEHNNNELIKLITYKQKYDLSIDKI